MMKYKPLVFMVVLTMAAIMLSGCNFGWLGELIPNIPGNPTRPVQGVFLGAQQFQLNPDENAITLQGLGAGDKVLLAISPWNSSTVVGVNYDIRVSLERVAPQTLGTLSGGQPTLLINPVSLPEGSGDAQDTMAALVGAGVPGAGDSDDYYSHIGNPAALSSAQTGEDTLTLQGASRSFWVKTDGSYRQVQGSLARDGMRIDIYVDDAVQVGTDYVEQILDAFNYTIYPKVTQTFGQPWDKDGNGKVILLITPLRYEGSDTKLVGYFDEKNLYDADEEDYSNAADMFYLNANVLGSNSLLVYGNLAHEFQHLIFAGAKLQAWRDNPHGSRFSQYYTDIWINEGFSMLAAHVTGYINLANDPRIFNSSSGYFARPHLDGLLTWDNGRPESNYGSAGLFAYYLYDRYKSVIKTILASDRKAEEVITADAKDFQVVFQNWMIANMADRMSNVSDSRYRYVSLDLQGAPAYVSLQSDDQSDIWSTGVRYYLIEGDGQDLHIRFTTFGGGDIPPLNGALIYFKPLP